MGFMNYQDKVIKCEHCGQNFAWTVDEQKFFASKSLDEPKRCMICRTLVKSASDDDFMGTDEMRDK